MKTPSLSHISRTLKAEIIFNQQQYTKITNFCQRQILTEKELIFAKLAKMQPLEMKK